MAAFVGLLLDLVSGEKPAHDDLGVRADVGGSLDETASLPLPVLPVRGRHVRRDRDALSDTAENPGVGAYPLAFEEDLHDVPRQAYLHFVSDVLVRDAVEHLLDQYVVRLVRRDLLPRREFVRILRQRQEKVLLLGEKGVEPAPLLLLEWFGVEAVELLPYPLVQLTQVEEGSVSKRRQDPRTDGSDRSFGVRLVPGLSDPRRWLYYSAEVALGSTSRWL